MHFSRKQIGHVLMNVGIILVALGGFLWLFATSYGGSFNSTAYRVLIVGAISYIIGVHWFFDKNNSQDDED